MDWNTKTQPFPSSQLRDGEIQQRMITLTDKLEDTTKKYTQALLKYDKLVEKAKKKEAQLRAKLGDKAPLRLDERFPTLMKKKRKLATKIKIMNTELETIKTNITALQSILRTRSSYRRANSGYKTTYRKGGKSWY